MECITPTFAPFIVEQDSEHHWGQQHAFGDSLFGEQLHQAQPKQPMLSHSNVLPKRKQWPSSHQQPAKSQLPLSSRRNSNSSNLYLQIPKHAAGVQKVVTPTKAKSPLEWEALLRTSLNDLRGAYANMQVPPAAPRQPQYKLSSQRPDFSGFDRIQMASRAMQMAAGFNIRGRRDMSAEYSDSGESSASESESEAEVEAPATPVTMEMGVMMNIDPQLFS